MVKLSFFVPLLLSAQILAAALPLYVLQSRDVIEQRADRVKLLDKRVLGTLQAIFQPAKAAKKKAEDLKRQEMLEEVRRGKAPSHEPDPIAEERRRCAERDMKYTPWSHATAVQRFLDMTAELESVTYRRVFTWESIPWPSVAHPSKKSVDDMDMEGFYAELYRELKGDAGVAKYRAVVTKIQAKYHPNGAFYRAAVGAEAAIIQDGLTAVSRMVQGKLIKAKNFGEGHTANGI